MPVVTEVLKIPNLTAARGARVIFQLAGPAGAGYVGTSSIVGKLDVPVAADGSYSVTLTGNADITPSGTRWKRTVVLPVGPNPNPEYLLVPSAGGPYVFDTILDSAPAALATPALTVEIANRIAGDATGIAYTDAQITALKAGVGPAYDTLLEIEAQITGDESVAGALATTVAGKAPKLTPTAVKTANYVAAAGDLVPVDTTSGAVTVTLPSAPADGTRVAVKHVIQGGTNVVTVNCGGSDVYNKTGGATSATLPLLAQAIQVQYKATGAIWYVVADDLPLPQLDARYQGIGTSVALTDVAMYHVARYGAVGDGVTDDTAAVLAAIDAATDAGGGIVQFARKTYLLNTAPRHDRGGNAILALKNITSGVSPTVVLRGVSSQQLQNISGEVGGTILKVTQTGLAYSGSFGPPSVIGGPTVENNGGAFSSIHARVEKILVLLPPNPTIAGIDLGYCVDGGTDGTCVMAWDHPTAPASLNMVQPTHVWAFGIRYPEAANFGVSNCYRSSAFGMYVGFVGETEHWDVQNLTAKWCYIGFSPHMLGAHGLLGGTMQVEWCTYSLAGWTAAAGLGNIVGNPEINLQMFDIEDAPAAHWFTSTTHIYDPTNALAGWITTPNSNPTRNGAVKLRFRTVSSNSQSQLGRQYIIDCLDGAVGGRSGTFAQVLDTTCWGAQAFYNTSGIGTFVTWAVPLDVGTYTVQIFTKHAASGGQFTFKIAGTQFGSNPIETYAASGAVAIETINSVAIGQGVNVVRIDVTGKNASSSNYNIILTKIIFTRTS